MKRFQFVIKLQHIGYSDEAIGHLLGEIDADRARNVHHRYEWYLPRRALRTASDSDSAELPKP